MKKKINLAIFASGRGSNFLAIARAIRKGRLKNYNLVFLLCDNPSAPVILKAKHLKVKTIVLDPSLFSTRQELEKEILKHLKENKIDFIALAGFMRILSPEFVKAYKNRILNIHPSLLPSFKGAHAIKDAFEYGVKVTGVTVHFVTEEVDSGPIILQEAVRIKEDDSLESLEKKIHKVEHKLYPQALAILQTRYAQTRYAQTRYAQTRYAERLFQG